MKYYERFSREVIYLWNDDVECYIKSDPKKGYFIKFKGKKEASISFDTQTVLTAVDRKQEVTKKEYEEA